MSRLLFSGTGFLLGILLAATVHAQAPAQWHMLIEPAFMKPEVTFPISGAQRTVMVPAYLNADNEPVYFTKAQFAALGVDLDGFMKQSRTNATDKKVSASFVRDSKQVVRYAVLQSENPLTATLVLAPDFLKAFGDVFGEKPLVAIPNRFTVYVFPQLASDYKDYAGLVIADYKDSAWPVSLEVFEAGVGGLKAVGTYEAP